MMVGYSWRKLAYTESRAPQVALNNMVLVVWCSEKDAGRASDVVAACLLETGAQRAGAVRGTGPGGRFVSGDGCRPRQLPIPCSGFRTPFW